MIRLLHLVFPLGFLALLLVLALGCSRSFTEVHRDTFGVKDQTEVSVSTFNGDITVLAVENVSTLDIRAVTVRSTLRNATRLRYVAAQHRDGISIQATARDEIVADMESGVDVELEIPRDTVLNLRTSNGLVSIDGDEIGVHGSIAVHVDNGQVVLANIHSSVSVLAERSPIFFDGVPTSGSQIRLATTGQPIFVASDMLDDVRIDAESTAGNIRFTLPSGQNSDVLDRPASLVIGDPKAMLHLRTSSAEIAIIPVESIPFP